MTTEKGSKMGMNRTGTDLSPQQAREMASAAEEMSPPPGDAGSLASIRQTYLKEADPVGSVPVPATLKGIPSSILDKLGGRNPEVLVDKLGERLAFERSGTRLYDYLIAKCEVASAKPAVPLDQLRHFREDESKHFTLVANALEAMGADPTAETPAADVMGVASKGILQVLSDPRTSVPQCLEAVLAAELVDNAGWELLIKLAKGLGLYEMAGQFEQALKDENEHLNQVRKWHEQAVLKESGAA